MTWSQYIVLLPLTITLPLERTPDKHPVNCIELTQAALGLPRHRLIYRYPELLKDEIQAPNLVPMPKTIPVHSFWSLSGHQSWCTPDLLSVSDAHIRSRLGARVKQRLYCLQFAANSATMKKIGRYPFSPCKAACFTLKLAYNFHHCSLFFWQNSTEMQT